MQAELQSQNRVLSLRSQSGGGSGAAGEVSVSGTGLLEVQEEITQLRTALEASEVGIALSVASWCWLAVWWLALCLR